MPRASVNTIPRDFLFTRDAIDRRRDKSLEPLVASGVSISTGWDDEDLTSDRKRRRRVESLWRTKHRHNHRRVKGDVREIPRRDSSPYILWFDGSWTEDEIALVAAECRDSMGGTLVEIKRGRPNLVAAKAPVG